MKLQPIRVMLRIGFLIGMMGMEGLLLQAQNPLVKQWDKRFGGTSYEQLFSFQQTSDGGYILGGTSDSPISGDKTQPVWGVTNEKDYWIVKINSLGIKQWDKRFGGLKTDWFKKVQQTSDGGYILGGTSTSNIGGDKSDSLWGGYSLDFWIVKVDSLGNKQWDKDYGGFDIEEFATLQQTKDGGYILGGSSYSLAGGDKSQGLQGYGDYWIIKIDSLGNKQWDKDFGGALYDDLYTILQTSDGGYLLGGASPSDSSGDKTQNGWGYDDYWLVKIDSLGNKMWDKTYGGTMIDALYSIIPTPGGGYLLGGETGSDISGNKTSPAKGGGDYWIIKIDSLGNKLWEKDFGSTGDDYFYSVENTNDGGYIINGSTHEHWINGDKSENSLGLIQMWAVKTDSLGNKQWDKTIFTASQGSNGLALQAKDGGYVFADWEQSGVGGYKTQPNWAGNSDYWIVRFYDSSSVNTTPSVNLSSSDTTFCEKHCIDFYDLSTNNPTSWQWFFPGSDSTTSTLQNPTNICYNQYGSFDVTLIACNAAGCDTLVLPDFINEYQTLTPAITQSNDTLFSSPGVAYQWWSVDSGIIAGANNSYYIPTQGGSYYVMVTDTNGCAGASNTIVIAGIENLTIDHRPLTIVPNPNPGNFTITLNENIGKDFSVRIINGMGQTIYNRQEAIVNGQWSIVISNHAKGIYTVELIAGEKVYRQMFVIATLPK